MARLSCAEAPVYGANGKRGSASGTRSPVGLISLMGWFVGTRWSGVIRVRKRACLSTSLRVATSCFGTAKHSSMTDIIANTHFSAADKEAICIRPDWANGMLNMLNEPPEGATLTRTLVFTAP